MTRNLSVLLIAAVLLLVPGHSFAATDAIVKAKCTTCHSVSSANLEKSNKSMKAPDLSAVGKEHDAAFFKKYLKKETPHVAHAGNDSVKQHPIPVKLSDAELETLTQELAGLKG